MKPTLNLFIIGASKCGTTTVWEYLNKFPEISMGLEKEPNIFSFSDWRSRLGHFIGDYNPEKKWLGEASTIYCETHITPETPRRIHEYNPHAKIIYIVRNPYDRLQSVWRQTLATGHHVRNAYSTKTDSRLVKKMPKSFRKAIWDYPIMIGACEYQKHYDAYVSYFPANQILLLYYEDLKEHPDVFYNQIHFFLDLDPTQAPNSGIWLNKRSGKEIITPPMISSLSGVLGLKPFFARNKALKSFLKRFTTLGINPNPAYNDKLRKSIRYHLRNDPIALKTFEIENRDLPGED